MKTLAVAAAMVLAFGPIFASPKTAAANDLSPEYFRIDLDWPAVAVIPVTVMNWPAVQAVRGTVNIGNLPAVQSVAGTVSVANMPLPTRPFHLVGFTAEVLPADSGVFGFTRACQAEFPGSRMCILQEALTTVSLPDLSSAGTPYAWIAQPEINPGWGIDCRGWSSVANDSNVRGRTLDLSGRYSDVACDSVLSVSCCASE